MNMFRCCNLANGSNTAVNYDDVAYSWPQSSQHQHRNNEWSPSSLSPPPTQTLNSISTSSFSSSGVSPVDGQEWGTEACSKFEELVLGIPLFALTLQWTEGGKHSLRLMDSSRDIVINEYMIQQGLALKTSPWIVDQLLRPKSVLVQASCFSFDPNN